MKRYIPRRGDLIWLNFTPQAGHEQRGQRPALVLSPKEYNKKTSLALCSPVTKHKKGYPFEVIVPEGLKIKGVILADQIKSLDWDSREAEFIDKLPDEYVNEVIEKFRVLLE